ncbi:MAG: hypothetical protein KZY57_03630 [Paeniclostridium sp.]|nr:hypothetical protein [Paeniclostridium sp.]MBW4861906.1 hypothetical protein [Paeniclostridium sp.]
MDKIYDFFYKMGISSILKQNALNNRELAYLTIIILGIIIIIISNKDKKGLLSAFVNILKIIFCKKIFGTIILLFIWVVLNCYILRKINIWNFSLVKSTLLWFITVGVFTAFKIVCMDKRKIEQYLKSILVNSVKITIFLDFIQNTYIFNFWIELAIGIFCVFIGLVQVVAEISKDKIKLQKGIDKIFMLIGLIWGATLIFKMITQPKALIDSNNLIEFISNIILTISMILPTYILGIYAGYENIFRRLKFRGNIDKSTKRYIRLKIILYAKIDPKKLDFRIYQKIFWLSDKKEIKNAFKDLKNGVTSISNKVV